MDNFWLPLKKHWVCMTNGRNGGFTAATSWNALPGPWLVKDYGKLTSSTFAINGGLNGLQQWLDERSSVKLQHFDSIKLGLLPSGPPPSNTLSKCSSLRQVAKMAWRAGQRRVRQMLTIHNNGLQEENRHFSSANLKVAHQSCGQCSSPLEIKYSSKGYWVIPVLFFFFVYDVL